MKKPSVEEFKVSESGVVHLPTKEAFSPRPGKPSDGHWRDGHQNADDYDQDEVRTLGRKLWAKFVADRKSAADGANDPRATNEFMPDRKRS